MNRKPQSATTVLLADPPWPHANGSRTNSGKSPKYPLMTIVEIENLSPFITELVGDDAVLYLWASAPHLEGALRVLSAWGFTYRSYMIWRKDRIGCGFWARSDAEIVLIGEKGRPAGPTGTIPATVFEGDRLSARHSSKPGTLHAIAERLWPSARKIELFARECRDGWQGLGFALGSAIGADSLPAAGEKEFANKMIAEFW